MEPIEWTTAMRYRPYASYGADYLHTLEQQQQQSPWHLAYHVQPNSGLLNDPNGFSYFDGHYHLFYQSFPYGPVHGLKSWHHLSSEDLVHFEDHGIGLAPDTALDSHGVYSGSALAVDDRLFIFYTGNVRHPDGGRDSYQLGAWMDKDNHIEKIDHILIDVLPGYTAHFRDPQLFERNGSYWMILGAQASDLTGRILLFKSEDLDDWSFVSEVNIGQDDLGYMVECPNLLFVDDRPLMIFCPQGLSKDVVPYQNIYPNMYVSGDAFDFETATLINPTPMRLLDHGLELYATQAMTAPDQRVLSVGWMGLPDLPSPSEQDQWAHNLSLIKELHFDGTELFQRPIAQYDVLKTDHQQVDVTLSDSAQWLPYSQTRQACYQLQLDDQTELTMGLFSDEQCQSAMTLSVDVTNGHLAIDRTEFGYRFENETGHQRALTWDKSVHPSCTLTLFVDRSTIEIFLNDGQEVISSQIFPRDNMDQFWVQGHGHVTVDYWFVQSV